MWTHHLPARLEGLEVFGRALHTTPLVGVASTVVPGCTSAIATCDDCLQDAARGSASPGRHGRQQRHKEGSTRPTGGLREVCGFAWVCMGFEFVVLGWGRESSDVRARATRGSTRLLPPASLHVHKELVILYFYAPLREES